MDEDELGSNLFAQKTDSQIDALFIRFSDFGPLDRADLEELKS